MIYILIALVIVFIAVAWMCKGDDKRMDDIDQHISELYDSDEQQDKQISDLVDSYKLQIKRRLEALEGEELQTVGWDRIKCCMLNLEETNSLMHNLNVRLKVLEAKPTKKGLKKQKKAKKTNK